MSIEESAESPGILASSPRTACASAPPKEGGLRVWSTSALTGVPCSSVRFAPRVSCTATRWTRSPGRWGAFGAASRTPILCPAFSSRPVRQWMIRWKDGGCTLGRRAKASQSRSACQTGSSDPPALAGRSHEHLISLLWLRCERHIRASGARTRCSYLPGPARGRLPLLRPCLSRLRRTSVGAGFGWYRLDRCPSTITIPPSTSSPWRSAARHRDPRLRRRGGRRRRGGAEPRRRWIPGPRRRRPNGAPRGRRASRRNVCSCGPTTRALIETAPGWAWQRCACSAMPPGSAVTRQSGWRARR